MDSTGVLKSDPTPSVGMQLPHKRATPHLYFAHARRTPGTTRAAPPYHIK